MGTSSTKKGNEEQRINFPVKKNQARNRFPGHNIHIYKKQIKNILDQMEKNLCKIYMASGGFGNGFFCKIPFPDKDHQLDVLFTNNHVLNKDAIENGKTIKFSLDNDKIKKEIVIDDTRKTYTSEELDTTIIELKPNDDEINSFLEIDYTLFES